eukprot:m.301575 g.301575  ORF g.301575 m.301575 type:complete len:329 (+) comp20143_c0_seq1:328-1314(+)
MATSALLPRTFCAVLYCTGIFASVDAAVISHVSNKHEKFRRQSDTGSSLTTSALTTFTAGFTDTKTTSSSSLRLASFDEPSAAGSSRQILVYETGKEGSMSKDHGIALITVLGGIILVLVGLLYKRGENAHVVPYERAKGASSPVRPYASLQPDGNFDTPRTTRLGPKYARMDNRGATFGGGLRMTRVSSEAILNPSDVSATTSTDSRTLHEHQYIPCRAASAMRDSVLYAAIPSRATSPQVSYRWTPQQEAYCVPCSRRTYEDALSRCTWFSAESVCLCPYRSVYVHPSVFRCVVVYHLILCAHMWPLPTRLCLLQLCPSVFSLCSP